MKSDLDSEGAGRTAGDTATSPTGTEWLAAVAAAAGVAAARRPPGPPAQAGPGWARPGGPGSARPRRAQSSRRRARPGRLRRPARGPWALGALPAAFILSKSGLGRNLGDGRACSKPGAMASFLLHDSDAGLPAGQARTCLRLLPPQGIFFDLPRDDSHDVDYMGGQRYEEC